MYYDPHKFRLSSEMIRSFLLFSCNELTEADQFALISSVLNMATIAVEKYAPARVTSSISINVILTVLFVGVLQKGTEDQYHLKHKANVEARI